MSVYVKAWCDRKGNINKSQPFDSNKIEYDNFIDKLSLVTLQ